MLVRLLSSFLKSAHVPVHFNKHFGQTSVYYRRMNTNYEHCSDLYDVDVNGAHAKVKYPGWTSGYWTFLNDLRLTLKTWEVSKFMMDCRFIAYFKGFMDVHEREKSHNVYIKCAHLQVNENGYDFIKPRSSLFDYDLDITADIVYMGKSSFQLDHKILHAPSGLEIMKQSLIFVSIDKETKKVASLPATWADKYRSLVLNTDKPLRISFGNMEPTDRNSVSQLAIRVMPTDTDYYGHTNYTRYPKFAMDSILEAWSQGKLTVNMDRQLIQNAIRSIEADNIGDSLQGETLVTETWEEATDPYSIWTRILREGKPIHVQKLQLMKL